MRDTSDRLIHEVKLEKTAHDLAVVDIKRGGRCPGTGLMLAKFLHFDNTQRAVHAPCSIM